MAHSWAVRVSSDIEKLPSEKAANSASLKKPPPTYCFFLVHHRFSCSPLSSNGSDDSSYFCPSFSCVYYISHCHALKSPFSLLLLRTIKWPLHHYRRTKAMPQFSLRFFSLFCIFSSKFDMYILIKGKIILVAFNEIRGNERKETFSRWRWTVALRSAQNSAPCMHSLKIHASASQLFLGQYGSFVAMRVFRDGNAPSACPLAAHRKEQEGSVRQGRQSAGPADA
jgi:hypothetical protein